MAVIPNDTYADRAVAGTLTGRHESKYAVPDDSVSVIKEVLTNAVTWNPAAFSATSTVAAGSFTSTTVTVTGAAVGDPASAALTTLNNTAGVAGVLIFARVTAANTVRVDLWNLSGTAALDVASGTLRVVVMKF